MKITSPAGKPIRVVQISDFHLLADPSRTMMGVDTDEGLRAVLDLARQNHAESDFFLLTGDLAQEATAATYRRLRSHLEVLPAPCYCLPGNHDDGELIRRELAGGNVFITPQILLDGWQVVCLDSTIPNDAGGNLGQEQLELLESKLEEQPHRHALICFHHSPLPTGAAWLDTMILANARELFAILSRHPQVRAVAFGHIHQAMDISMNGVRFLGCPSTCFQFKAGCEDFALDFMPQGYRWIDLYPDGAINTEVVRLERAPEGLDLASGGY